MQNFVYKYPTLLFIFTLYQYNIKELRKRYRKSSPSRNGEKRKEIKQASNKIMYNKRQQKAKL